MKIIISSKALLSRLTEILEKEIVGYRLIDGGLEFVSSDKKAEAYYIGCETGHYGNKANHHILHTFNEKAWCKIRNVLRSHFPEQPITMTIDDCDIRIEHCVLIFPNE